jgi:hypothetical protein
MLECKTAKKSQTRFPSIMDRGAELKGRSPSMPNSGDVALRIAGVGDQTPGFERLLREIWGFRPVRDGDDWVVLDTDPALRAAPRDVLRMHGPLSLKQANRHRLAGKMIAWIPGRANELLDRLGQTVTYEYEEDSALDRIYACRSRLATCRTEDVRTIVRDALLPFMIEMDVTEVYGVTVDIQYQGSIYTFSKFGLLIKEYGLQDVERLVFEREALKGILPNALNVLWYVNTLTRLAPIAFTLAIERGDCAWHFVGSGAFVFQPSVSCEGLFHQFTQAISPVSERSVILPSASLPTLTKDGAHVFLRVVVNAVNSIARFLNDLKSFVGADTKEVDFSKQTQAFGALDLLFADIACLNYSTSGFHRISCSMSAMDKLANLVRHLETSSASEPEIFKSLFSMEQCRRSCEIVRARVEPVNSYVASVLVQMLSDVYEAVHSHYKQDMGDTASEAEILDRIRQQRNLRHGTFLEGDRFRRLFGQTKGTVAEEVMMIPYLLTLTLALDPPRFLRLA